MTNEKALKEFNYKKNQYLFLSVILDILGMASYLIPFLGEVEDVVFAPFYGLAIFIMYKKSILPAALGGTTGFIEEILPGADIVPTATIMWIYTYIFRKEKTLKSFVKEKNQEIQTLSELSTMTEL